MIGKGVGSVDIGSPDIVQEAEIVNIRVAGAMAVLAETGVAVLIQVTASRQIRRLIQEAAEPGAVVQTGGTEEKKVAVRRGGVAEIEVEVRVLDIVDIEAGALRDNTVVEMTGSGGGPQNVIHGLELAVRRIISQEHKMLLERCWKDDKVYFSRHALSA